MHSPRTHRTQNPLGWNLVRGSRAVSVAFLDSLAVVASFAIQTAYSIGPDVCWRWDSQIQLSGRWTTNIAEELGRMKEEWIELHQIVWLTRVKKYDDSSYAGTIEDSSPSNSKCFARSKFKAMNDARNSSSSFHHETEFRAQSHLFKIKSVHLNFSNSEQHHNQLIECSSNSFNQNPLLLPTCLAQHANQIERF